MRVAAVTGLVLLVGCGQPSTAVDDGGRPPDSGLDGASPDSGSLPDAGHPGDAGSVDAGPQSDAGPPGDAGQLDAGVDAGTDAGRPAPDGGTYRNSLRVCWTDATCTRALAVAHGGAWDAVNLPYDSNGALAAAFTGGLDGVKIDVRVTADNVPIIAHSSPIQLYESVDCYNQTIETMTAAQVTGCHRFPSTTEKFQRLDDVLSWLRGKLVVQLTVKRPADYARTIAQVHASNAEDFAFLEISTGDLQTLIPSVAGSATVYYLISISNLTEVDTLLNVINSPRAFMFEFDPATQLGTLVTSRLHPAGVRAFTYTAAAAPTVAELKALYDTGYDVVSAQGAANNVQARTQANQARGVAPP